MDPKTFAQIRTFAIDKEIEAVQLYSHMASKAELAHVRTVFEGLAEEERKHRRMLQDLKVAEIADTDLAHGRDLRLSDYLVEQEFRPDMAYQDVLILAMKREERALALYSNLAKGTSGAIRRLFEFLAGQELGHKEKLQREYDEAILSEN